MTLRGVRTDTAATGVVRIRIEELREYLTGVFADAGLTGAAGSRVADALVEAELTGNPTHGVLRVAGYVRGLRSGRYATGREPTVTRPSAGAVLVDGHGSLGYEPTWRAVSEAVDLARASGVGVAGVRRIGEFGRAAYYVREATRRGCVAVVCQNTQPMLAAPGGRLATHGNNPLAFSTPGADAPVFDAAFTPRSGGELGRRKVLGLPIPEEWGYVDPHGHPTTDPGEAFHGVHPAVGGAKGFGLAVLVDLLAGVLTGSASGRDAVPGEPGVGAFVLALDPDVLGAAARLPTAMAESARAVRTSGARWPGDRAAQARADHLEAGFVEIPAPIWTAARRAVAHTEGP
ncbi:MAG: Ldh family oxidoreductase [Pseudonocardia sp.]|nr:Ldh family oxidoreductase [Pseudonocardia sp.]